MPASNFINDIKERKRKKRPNRTAAARRQQYARAKARTVQSMLRCFQSLEHRGCDRTKLGAAMYAALRAPDEHAAPGVPGIMDIKHMLEKQANTLSRLAATVAGIYDSQYSVLKLIHSSMNGQPNPVAPDQPACKKAEKDGPSSTSLKVSMAAAAPAPLQPSEVGGTSTSLRAYKADNPLPPASMASKATNMQANTSKHDDEPSNTF